MSSSGIANGNFQSEGVKWENWRSENVKDGRYDMGLL